MEKYKKYKIGLHGCDDTTYIEIELTHEEKNFVDRLVKLSEENSTYSCMPTMDIQILSTN